MDYATVYIASLSVIGSVAWTLSQTVIDMAGGDSYERAGPPLAPKLIVECTSRSAAPSILQTGVPTYTVAQPAAPPSTGGAATGDKADNAQSALDVATKALSDAEDRDATSTNAIIKKLRAVANARTAVLKAEKAVQKSAAASAATHETAAAPTPIQPGKTVVKAQPVAGLATRTGASTGPLPVSPIDANRTISSPTGVKPRAKAVIVPRAAVGQTQATGARPTAPSPVIQKTDLQREQVRQRMQRSGPFSPDGAPVGAFFEQVATDAAPVHVLYMVAPSPWKSDEYVKLVVQLIRAADACVTVLGAIKPTLNLPLFGVKEVDNGGWTPDAALKAIAKAVRTAAPTNLTPKVYIGSEVGFTEAWVRGVVGDAAEIAYIPSIVSEMRRVLGVGQNIDGLVSGMRRMGKSTGEVQNMEEIFAQHQEPSTASGGGSLLNATKTVAMFPPKMVYKTARATATATSWPVRKAVGVARRQKEKSIQHREAMEHLALLKTNMDRDQIAESGVLFVKTLAGPESTAVDIAGICQASGNVNVVTFLDYPHFQPVDQDQVPLFAELYEEVDFYSCVQKVLASYGIRVTRRPSRVGPASAVEPISYTNVNPVQTDDRDGNLADPVATSTELRDRSQPIEYREDPQNRSQWREDSPPTEAAPASTSGTNSDASNTT